MAAGQREAEHFEECRVREMGLGGDGFFAGGLDGHGAGLPANGFFYVGIIFERGGCYGGGAGAFDSVAAFDGDEDAEDLVAIEMELIVAGVEAIDLDAPDHGGDGDAQAEDIDEGVAAISMEMAEDDPAVVGEHGWRFLRRCRRGGFP